MSRARKNRKRTRTKQPQQQQAQRQWTENLNPSRYALVAVLLGVAVYRLVMLAGEAAPPGADPGNWLAYTHGLFDTSVKAAESMYFPVTLIVLKALLVFLPPLMAAKVLGVGASVAVAVPFYLILRRGCSPLLAAGLTLAFVLAGYQQETLSFGGYPQLLATAFLLLTVYWLMDGLISGRRRPLLLAAASTALIAGTHHFTLALLVPTVSILALALVVQERPSIGPFLRNAGAWMVAAALFTLPFLPWYVRFFTLLDGNPANALGLTLMNMDRVISYVFENNEVFWTALLIIAGVLPLLPFFGRRAAGIRPAVLALLAGPFLAFAVTNEVRSFQLIQAGVVLSLGLPVAAIEQHLAQTEMRVAVRRLERLSLALGAATILIIVGGSGHQRFTETIARYQIVDDSALEALNWLRERSPPGAIVMANDSPTRVSYAWWVEGYAERPTYSLIEPAFLSFAEEKEQAALARRLLEQDTSPAEVQSLLERTGINYIFLDKRTGGRFRPLLSKASFYISLENEHFAVLRYPGARVEANR